MSSSTEPMRYPRGFMAPQEPRNAYHLFVSALSLAAIVGPRRPSGSRAHRPDATHPDRRGFDLCIAFLLDFCLTLAGEIEMEVLRNTWWIDLRRASPSSSSADGDASPRVARALQCDPRLPGLGRPLAVARRPQAT
jgi:hypothetical protein